MAPATQQGGLTIPARILDHFNIASLLVTCWASLGGGRLLPRHPGNQQAVGRQISQVWVEILAGRGRS